MSDACNRVSLAPGPQGPGLCWLAIGGGVALVGTLNPIGWLLSAEQLASRMRENEPKNASRKLKLSESAQC
jgi:hypothetical protein